MRRAPLPWRSAAGAPTLADAQAAAGSGYPARVAIGANLLARLGVEPAERSTFGWAALTLFGIGAAAVALLNTAETLFLKRVGVEWLPAALLTSAALLVVGSSLVGRAAARGRRGLWLVGVPVASGALLVPASLLAGGGTDAVFFALLVGVRQILPLCLLVFFPALGDVLTGRQAKRLFAPLSAGITLGGICGSFASGPLGEWMGLQGLLAASGGMLLAAGAAAQRLRAVMRGTTRGRSRGTGTRSARPRAAASGQASLASLWRDSRLFRLLAVALVCEGMLSPILGFEFAFLADAATRGSEGEIRLLALFGTVRGSLNVVILVAQVRLSSWLYARIGLPLALALWPAVYVLGFGWLASTLALSAGIGTLSAARVAQNGVSGPALRVVMSLFPEPVRARAASLLEGPVNRSGSLLGNGLVLALLPLVGPRALAVLALPVGLVWLVVAVGLRRAYARLLLQASSDRRLDRADRARLLDPGTLRALGTHLVDRDPRRARAALDLIGQAEPALAVEVLAGALPGAGAVTRGRIVGALHRRVALEPGDAVRTQAAVDALTRALDGAGGWPPGERADLVQCHAWLTASETPDADGRGPSDPVLRRALGDAEPAVRLAATAELARRGDPPPGLADLEAVLDGALAADDALLRRAARWELRAMLAASPADGGSGALTRLGGGLDSRADRAETASALADVARRLDGEALPLAPMMLSHADDPDPEVRAGVLRFAGHAGIRAETGRLLEALDSRHEAEARAAHEALLALGAPVVLPHLEERGLAELAGCDRALELLGELDADAATLDALYVRGLGRARRHAVWSAALRGGERLLARHLDERIGAEAGALLVLVSARRDEGRLAALERRLRQSREPRERDVLLEAVDATLPSVARTELVPLLERGAPAARGRAAAAALDETIPERGVALREMASAAEPLARRLAAWALERGSAMGNPPAMADPVELASQLEAVPPLDRLPVRRLLRLAERCEDLRFEDGATIFAEGDEESGVFVLLEGGVGLEHGADRVVPVAAGSVFGELSALDGVPREATARARGAVRALRIPRAEILELLAEVPAFSIGVADRLSLRVRALEQRLRTRGPGAG